MVKWNENMIFETKERNKVLKPIKFTLFVSFSLSEL